MLVYTADRITSRRRLLEGVACLALSPFAAACSPSMSTPQERSKPNGEAPKATLAAGLARPTEAPKVEPIKPPQGTLKELKSVEEKVKLKEARYKYFHTLEIIDGKTPPVEPYYSGFFKKEEFDKLVQDGKPPALSEGWEYSLEEFKIHKNPMHYAMDIDIKWGTTLLIPIHTGNEEEEMYASASFDSHWAIDDATKKTITYRGENGQEEEQPIRFGLGYFIQVYIPRFDRFFLVAHVSEVDKEIVYSPPTYDAATDGYNPTNHNLSAAARSLENIRKNPNWVRVKPGQVIGKVGFSGLTWGKFEEYRQGEKRPISLDPTKLKSWDKAHGHFQDHTRTTAGGLAGRRDFIGEYGIAPDDYPLRLDRVNPRSLIRTQSGIYLLAA